MKKQSRCIVGWSPSPSGNFIVWDTKERQPYAYDGGAHYIDYWAAQERAGCLNLPAKDREKSASIPSSPPSTETSAVSVSPPTAHEGGGETETPPVVVEKVTAMVTESARAVACPTCKAGPGDPCVTRSGLEVQGYDVHSPRAKAWATQQIKATGTQTPEEGAA